MGKQARHHRATKRYKEKEAKVMAQKHRSFVIKVKLAPGYRAIEDKDLKKYIEEAIWLWHRTYLFGALEKVSVSPTKKRTTQ